MLYAMIAGWALRHIKLSVKGAEFTNYLLDDINGKSHNIYEFEEVIRNHMNETGESREDTVTGFYAIQKTIQLAKGGKL